MFPDKFIDNLKKYYSVSTIEALLYGLQSSPETSVRLNPAKMSIENLSQHFKDNNDGVVEWCKDAIYLKERPNFTLDPVFHSGAYYVQEASSMYVGALFKQIRKEKPLRVLDLCAAPGGKTTHILSLLSDEDLLIANEVIRSRATVLAENCAKWGAPNVIVTNNDPSEFKQLKGYFDIILVDAPCSGEGMFRKDENAVEQWSLNNVALCASRQRRILSDIWDSLAGDGHLIYSTCTFNGDENGENVKWVCSELGGELIEQRQFLPGTDRGEGFFCSLIRKNGKSNQFSFGKNKVKPTFSTIKSCSFIKEGYSLIEKGELLKAYPTDLILEMKSVESLLKSIHSGVAIATIKGKDLVPEADLAMSNILHRDAFPSIEVSKEDALKFLSKENLSFTDQPKGYLLLTYEGYPLGFVKNLGNRSNNLHPAARRIRNLSPQICD